MSIVPKVGRKSAPVATFLTVCYTLLTLGGLTMVIPFLIMLTSAVSNEWDYEQFNVFPRYVIDRKDRYLKFVAEKYHDISKDRYKFRRDYSIFQAAYQPKPSWTGFRPMREDPELDDYPPMLYGIEKRTDRTLEQFQRIRIDYMEWMQRDVTPLVGMPMFGRFLRPMYQDFMRDKYEKVFFEKLKREGKGPEDVHWQKREQGALDAMAEAWDEAKFTSFFFLNKRDEAVYPYWLRKWLPTQHEMRWQDYFEFVRSLPADWRVPITARHLWLRYLQNAAGDLKDFRRKTGVGIDSYNKLPCPDSLPTAEMLARWRQMFPARRMPGWMAELGEVADPDPRSALQYIQDLWLTFARDKWPMWMIQLPADLNTPEGKQWAGRWRDFLRGRCRKGLEKEKAGLASLGDADKAKLLAEMNAVLRPATAYASLDQVPEDQWLVKKLNDLVKDEKQKAKAPYASFADVPYSGTTPIQPLEKAQWQQFLMKLHESEPDVLAKHRNYPELSYRLFLQGKYASVDELNKTYGWAVKDFDQIQIPIAEVDYAQFNDQEGWFVKKFLTYNFGRVFNFMVVQGRAFLNTFILVSLAIIACLTVNPLAAYALSRFQMKHASKILLFLLATMAFPHEVSMIPNFLLLRELGLLNTFGALVLPSLANGFAIFLLKGFFDSLPTELYEAATIDGASEMTMFARITLPLCKPILAYQALLAFIAAYGGFMWAFLVCQDPKMWTVMVWMYQYQQTAQAFPYMVMAAFVLASIPTLVVFLFCQKIILRGIIIPVMK